LCGQVGLKKTLPKWFGKGSKDKMILPVFCPIKVENFWPWSIQNWKSIKTINPGCEIDKDKYFWINFKAKNMINKINYTKKQRIIATLSQRKNSSVKNFFSSSNKQNFQASLCMTCLPKKQSDWGFIF